jgi:hypothetical protein
MPVSRLCRDKFRPALHGEKGRSQISDSKFQRGRDSQAQNRRLGHPPPSWEADYGAASPRAHRRGREVPRRCAPRDDYVGRLAAGDGDPAGRGRRYENMREADGRR